MQSKVKPQLPEAAKSRYPRLMQVRAKNSTSVVPKIVLFTEYNTGVVVSPGAFDQIGVSHNSWDENQFEDFNGIVELSN